MQTSYYYFAQVDTHLIIIYTQFVNIYSKAKKFQNS